MHNLTNKKFDTAATFMTMAAKSSLAAINAMREQAAYYPVEKWDIEGSGETTYIMEVMIAHLRYGKQTSEDLHNNWVESQWHMGLTFGPTYVPGKEHPKAMHWQSLIIPAKIELDMIRGIVSCVVRSVVDQATLADYIAALDSADDEFMVRTMN